MNNIGIFNETNEEIKELETVSKLIEFAIKHENLDFSILEKVIRNVPVKDNLTAVRLAEHLKELMNENNITNIQLLSLMENYFYQCLREKVLDNQYRRNITEFLKKINITKNQIKQYVDETSALENLFLL